MSSGGQNIAILCIGNILMLDEGIGPRIAAELLESFEFPENVAVLDRAVMGMQLLNELKEYDVILVVDAVENSGHPPGVVLRFAPEDMARYNSFHGAHDTRFVDVLDAAALLGFRPKGHCLGVQVENMSPAELTIGLTPAVASAIPLALYSVLGFLAERGVSVIDKKTGMIWDGITIDVGSVTSVGQVSAVATARGTVAPAASTNDPTLAISAAGDVPPASDLVDNPAADNLTPAASTNDPTLAISAAGDVPFALDPVASTNPAADNLAPAASTDDPTPANSAVSAAASTNAALADNPTPANNSTASAAASPNAALVADLKRLPRISLGALFMPAVWGPAHGQWVAILFYPLWIFADTCFCNAVLYGGLAIALAVTVFAGTAFVMVFFAMTAGRSAYLRVAKRISINRYLKRERVWIFASLVIAVVFLGLATWYNLSFRFPAGI